MLSESLYTPNFLSMNLERWDQRMSPFILIVDDNALNRDVLAVILREVGISFAGLESPVNLKMTLDQMTHLDAVFLDLEMPGMNGYEALEVLKAHPVSHDIPVVAYTVHVSQVNQARSAGFHSFLAKPIDSTQFISHLNRILSGESVWEI